MTPEVSSRLEVLKRICARGRSYFFDKQDTWGIDCFQHMEDEVKLLESALLKSDESDTWF